MPNDLIGRYVHARERAEKVGDRSVVRECDFHLNRLDPTGRIRAGTASAAMVDRAEEAAEAEVRPRRGRPPIRRDV